MSWWPEKEPAAVPSDHLTDGGGRAPGLGNGTLPYDVTWGWGRQKARVALLCEEAVGGSGGSAAQLILGFRR